VARLRTPLLLITAFMLAAGACSSGGGQDLDLAKAEREIRKLAVAAYSTTAKVGGVQCPKQVAQEKGNTFTCTVTIDGQPLTIRVRQKDDKGNVRISQDQAVIFTAKAESYVASYARSRGAEARAVSCGRRPVLIRAPGEIISCRVEYTDGATGVARMQVANTDAKVGMQRLTHG
jgi:hypothetical protein